MLDKSDVDQMVRDAQEHAEEDKQRREEVETRNQAEALTFQAERALKDLGDKVSSEDKLEVENKIESLREALKGSDMDVVKTGMTSLAESLQRVSTAAYQAAASAGRGVRQRVLGRDRRRSTDGAGPDGAEARRGRGRGGDGRGRVQGGLGLVPRRREGPRVTAGLSIPGRSVVQPMNRLTLGATAPTISTIRYAPSSSSPARRWSLTLMPMIAIRP